MKIRKLESNGPNEWQGSLCFAEMSAVGTTILALDLALDRAQNSAALTVTDSGEFQRRCSDAIFALTNKILETVEAHYASETKKFKVSYDIKRSGVHTMEVEAESESEAKRIAEERIGKMPEDEFQELATEFIASDVLDAKEVKQD